MVFVNLELQVSEANRKFISFELCLLRGFNISGSLNLRALNSKVHRL